MNKNFRRKEPVIRAFMASFVFKPLNKRLILSGGNPLMASFASYMPLACIGLVQALLLLLTLQFGLNLQIDNVGLYYGYKCQTFISGEDTENKGLCFESAVA